IAGRVEGTPRADLGRALRNEPLRSRRRGEGVGLELGAAQDVRTTGSTIVEGDQGVARELAAKVEGVRPEGERAGRARPGTAGDEEQDSARRAGRGKLLDVEPDRAGCRAASVEWHIHGCALDSVLPAGDEKR